MKSRLSGKLPTDDRKSLFVVYYFFNPFTPRSDQYLNSPYKFNTWSRQAGNEN